MKRIMLVLDGVADRENKLLEGKTPLEYAKTPNLDALFQKSKAGTVKTIPDGLEIGSAVANLGLLGFNAEGYRGRAIIEAAGLNMPINEDDLYIRCNMVHFEGDSFESSRMKSYSAFEIETEKAEPVARAMAEAVYGGDYSMHYCGSFRNILIVKNGKSLYPVDFMPAHDIIGQEIKQYIQREGKQAVFFDLMEKSYDFLQQTGSVANGVWFWGASVMPDIKGETAGRAVLSETLLMNGITKLGGLLNIETEREGKPFEAFLKEKLKHSLDALSKADDVYIHIQETDDLSHELMPKEKAEAVEAVDNYFLPGLLEALNGTDYTLKIASDHYTFSDNGSHGGDPVPFLFYDSKNEQAHSGRFTEKDCMAEQYTVTSKELVAL
ncbi:MAG: hypothetical protein ACOYJB_09780 [Christensenellaceae bacterium]|jgi:2,3-bisphosphoglycerate-independent phosphoglycerate mutase